MAAKPDPQPKDKGRKKPVIDPALDITSDRFDPLRALYASVDLLRPVKHAQCFDNISMYASAVAKQEQDGDAGKAHRPSTSAPPTAVSDTNPFQRKFQPHQLMLPGTGPKARHQRNLLQRIADSKFEGPLAALAQFQRDGCLVRVYTRNASGICGHLTGRVQLFDRHWNMALTDVTEVRTRRKAYRCDVAAERAESQDTEEDILAACTKRLRQLRLRLPPMDSVRSLDRKRVECTRRLAGAMVRGEQVALVRCL